MIFGISGTKHFVRNREVSVGEVRLYLDTEIVLISDVIKNNDRDPFNRITNKYV